MNQCDFCLITELVPYCLPGSLSVTTPFLDQKCLHPHNFPLCPASGSQVFISSGLQQVHFVHLDPSGRRTELQLEVHFFKSKR